MSLHEGHRQRMYEKVAKDALAEHEWLEVLLFGCLPRRNTNDIAHRLIATFGSDLNVFSASMEDLKKVPGVGDSVAAQICAIGHFFKKYREKQEPTFTEKFSSRAFLPFVKKTCENVFFEMVELYLLDGDGHVLKKQRFSIESICTVRVLPEDISAFLLSEGSSGVVMVHNHPYGEATPSEADDLMTKNCQMLCSIHNKLFCDHIIYAPNGMYSYYLSGRMGEISKNYSVSKFLDHEYVGSGTK